MSKRTTAQFTLRQLQRLNAACNCAVGWEESIAGAYRKDQPAQKAAIRRAEGYESLRRVVLARIAASRPATSKERRK